MTDATKTCPACQTSIDARASRCPACAQRQPDAPGIFRDVPGRLAGGVCAALALHFNWDVTLMRVLFVASVAITGPLVFWVYPIIWAMTPFEQGGKTPLVKFVDAIGRLFSPPQSAPPQQDPPTSV